MPASPLSSREKDLSYGEQDMFRKNMALAAIFVYNVE